MVFQLQTFNLIPAQQISTIEAIAMAKAITSGVSVARQVNDNDGNALSTASPSRVISGTERQWVAQSQDENAPCHDFLLVQEPNLCRGLYSVRDYVTQYDESKKFIEFSTREFLEDSLINSFLNPLLITKENDRYNLLNNDTIAIIPAVYSDKNTVTKMIINLKPLLNKLGIKTTKDLLKNPNKYTPVLKKYINEQLFKYYDKVVTKISNDLKNLSKASIFRLIKFSGNLEYSATSYNEL
jgi:hypothetical protein